MGSSKDQQLSPAQERILTNLAQGQRWDSHIRNRSAYGGARGTLASLARLGLVYGREITEQGRLAIAAATKAA